MNETPIDDKNLSKWQQHRFLIMLGAAIVTALFLVSVALALYASSGAAQLDLSRPGYVSVREQANRDESFDGFSATGPLDKQAIDQFRKLYDKQANKATSVDSFGGNAMNDQTLSLDAPANE
jgi:hypothetical protein